MKKILLVEDDVFVRDIYSRELKKGDYEIVLAEDGQIGIDKATSEQFDLEIVQPLQYEIIIKTRVEHNTQQSNNETGEC